MHTVPPVYGTRRRGMGDTTPAVVIPAAASSPAASSSGPAMNPEIVDALPDAPRDAPPSTYAVVDFLDGANGSIVRLAGLTLLRTAFIVPGIYLASKITKTEMGLGKVMGFALASSATITGGMVGWYALRRRFPSSRARAQQGATA